jgi:hypothetical protein
MQNKKYTIYSGLTRADAKANPNLLSQRLLT